MQVNKEIEKKVIQFGFFSCFIWLSFTSFNSTAYLIIGLLTKIYEDTGKIGLPPFQYTIFILTNISFSNTYYLFPLTIKMKGILAACLQIFSYCCSFLALHADPGVDYVFSGIAGLFGGFSYIFFAVVQSMYLACLCQDEAQNMKGHYFGICYLIDGWGCLASSLLSLLTLGLISSDVFLFTIMAVSILNTIYGYLILEDFDSNEEIPSSILSGFQKTFNFYPTIKHVVLIIAIEGIEMGIVTLTMVHMLPEKSSFFISTIGMISYAVGSIPSGYLGARMADFYSFKTCAFSVLFLFLITCLVSVWAVWSQMLWVSLLAFFLWGFSMDFCDAFFSIINCKVYAERVEAYIIHEQFSSLAEFIYAGSMTFTKNQTPVPLLMGIVSVLSIPALLWVRIWEPQKIIQQLEEEQQSFLFSISS